MKHEHTETHLPINNRAFEKYRDEDLATCTRSDAFQVDAEPSIYYQPQPAAPTLCSLHISSPKMSYYSQCFVIF